MMEMMRKLFLLSICLSGLCVTAARPQTRTSWRAASAEELEAALPARAPVVKERIETEMRTASGIVNERGQLIGAVVLITAGYSADGKYSHYFLAQAPITIANHIALPAGAYVVGWKHADDGLMVRFFDAATGAERGAEVAQPLTGSKRIESFRIWPPAERPIIQIGRYMLPYSVGQ
jgi:hypothetical protein